MDGFGELPGASRAAAEFAQDAPGLELDVGALGGNAAGGWARLARLLRCGLVPAAVRDADMLAACPDLALVREGD